MTALAGRAVRASLERRLAEALVGDTLPAPVVVAWPGQARATPPDASGGIVYLQLLRVSEPRELRNARARPPVDERLGALDLHYLLWPDPVTPADGERLIGAALDWLRETPVLAMDSAARPSVTGPGTEWRLLLTHQELTLVELTALWHALGIPGRPVLAFMVHAGPASA